MVVSPSVCLCVIVSARENIQIEVCMKFNPRENFQIDECVKFNPLENFQFLPCVVKDRGSCVGSLCVGYLLSSAMHGIVW